ncbi:MAG: hypothetical protein J0M08_11245 [Bacteroidetes bacterium]|nr:hypothetical protein [Bacteroidota bacterium]
MNQQLLIADSGSTKTDWCLVSNGSKEFFSTIGFSPYFQSSNDISKELSENLLPKIRNQLQPNCKLFFYGTGCSSEDKIKIVYNALRSVFPDADITINHDLLAAARALLGKENGIAAILGTGANTCLYDGMEIIENVTSLGFILGDEGSGAHIGKSIVKSIIYKELDKDVLDDFANEYKLDVASILDAVYKKPLPNRFLASFAKFAFKHKSNLGVKKILYSCFDEFFINHICKYDGYKNLPFNCVGSIAINFADEISFVASKYGIKLGKTLQSPILGLIEYHKE